MLVKFTVTEEDIRQGQENLQDYHLSRSRSCPVILAIRRTIGGSWQTGTYILADDDYDFQARLPDHVAHFIIAADKNSPGLEPFEFEMDIPDELLQEGFTQEGDS